MVLNKKYFEKKYWQTGSSMMEVVLAIALVLAVTPFLYSQISEMTDMVQDIHYAKKIVGMRNNIITFVRVNEADWDRTGVTPEIKPEELKELAPGAKNMIIDNQGNETGVIDVYLVFPKRETSARTAKVVKYIGHDAAVVQPGGIAYAQNWAVQDEKNFEEGDLIFKISRDYALENKTNYLHREAGDHNLTTMLRDLHMNSNYMYNVGKMTGNKLNMRNSIAAKVKYLNSTEINAENVRFLSGLNLQNPKLLDVQSVSYVNTLYGFNIVADTVNENPKTLKTLIMGNSVTVQEDLQVGKDLILKPRSDDQKNIIDIISINTKGLSTAFIKADTIKFTKNSLGITVASDLWPRVESINGLTLRQGNDGNNKELFWDIASNKPALSFSKLTLESGDLPNVIDITNTDIEKALGIVKE